MAASTYTVDTLAATDGRGSARELFFLLGADSLADLPTWREPARICQLAALVVVGRAGQPVDFSPLTGLIDSERLALFRKLLVEMPLVDLSSRRLRSLVAQGRSIRYRTPRAVEKYIESHALYRGERMKAEG